MKSQINVIVVEDDNLSREGIVLLLEQKGINVIGKAEHGQELKQLLKFKKPDIVILDLEMPVLNGSKTLNFLSKEYPHIKVIILSRYHDKDLIKDLFNRKATAFVSKVESITILIEAIQRVYKYQIYKDNLPFLLMNPAMKDGHYYRLIYSNAEVRLLSHLLDSQKTYQVIADELCVSVKTVENQAKGIYSKAEVKSRIEFLEYGHKVGLKYLENPWSKKQ